MKKLIKKNHFIFPNKIAKLIFNKSYSNLFISLVDFANNVIVCKTSGACDVGSKKKKKTSPLAVEKIVIALLPYFKVYGILKLDIILKTKITSHIHNLVKYLNKHGILIVTFRSSYSLPHNGVRGRKVRRI